MIRTALSLSLAAGLALAAAMPASASVDPKTQRAPAQTVMICAEDSATRASFEREYGERPVFVSARDLLAARDAGERWEAPRCMTEREYARYERISEQRAELRR
ncbi:hypothetical protein [Brevundimonas halotolerans]|uniref:Photosystem II stability/assembly factor-like uncharacterized protein n=1 Tax=Brevundimonas halotolerans TaxID=69670 RepID=A0A7W9E6X1_9CAUL|nr:hypothetical protein [Brevundimonas halotolerans]MBB5660757.1 photosystem II stability/assembly factor-like uncharacterized protein [Brevundimonas halotolerans]